MSNALSCSRAGAERSSTAKGTRTKTAAKDGKP